MTAHIIHVTSAHPPLDIRIFHKECKSLAQAGYKVSLVAPAEEDQMVEGVQIRAVKFRPRNRWVRFTWMALQTTLTALREEGSVYHLHDPELLPWSFLFRLKGKRVVFDMHENLPLTILSKPYIPLSARRFIARLVHMAEFFLLRNVPVIYAAESQVKDYPFIKKSCVVQNMPRLELLLGIQSEKLPVPTIGYMGGVNSLRGSLISLEALKILQEKGYTINFECVGEFTEAHQTELREKLLEYGLTGVQYHGYLPHQEAIPIISRCHIGLAILSPITNYLEAYPTKMFEYMALGMPVVVSNFPLYKQVIEGAQCGLCVDPQNALALAEAIRYLLDHPEEASLMGSRGREKAIQSYSWANEESKLLSFYQDILKQDD